MCACDSATVVLVVLVQAMGMSGQKLFGVPIMLQPTMAEKNRYVWAMIHINKHLHINYNLLPRLPPCLTRPPELLLMLRT